MSLLRIQYPHLVKTKDTPPWGINVQSTSPESSSLSGGKMMKLEI